MTPQEKIADAKQYLRLLKTRHQLQPHLLQFKLDLEKRIVVESKKIERRGSC